MCVFVCQNLNSVAGNSDYNYIALQIITIAALLVLKKKKNKKHFRNVVKTYTEDPRNNDSLCYQTFCGKIEFAVIKKLDMDPSTA